MNSVHDLSQPPHDFNLLDGAGAGSSSVGTSLDAPFLAAFSAAAGRRATTFSASEESDSQVLSMVIVLLKYMYIWSCMVSVSIPMTHI